VLVAEHPPGWAPERSYALRVVCEELLGLPVAARVDPDARGSVALTVAGHGGRVSVADGLFALDEALRLDPRSLPADDPPRLDGLPVIYGRPELTLADGEARLGVDVFGSAFFCLSRYEELVTSARDELDRFAAAQSYASRNGLLWRPLVDEWAALLRRALEHVWPGLPAPRREFRVVPTHDVDWPRAPEQGAGRRLAAAAASLLRRDARGAAVRLRALAGGRDAFDTFDWIMAASEARSLRSAFYFIVDGPSPAEACGYGIDEDEIRSLLRACAGRGHELGLHGSLRSFRDPDRLRQERDRLLAVCREERIEQASWGGRQHYLRWDARETWPDWEAAGLDYDSTAGYHDATGFRCGTCAEFPVYDHRRRTQLRLRERPLVVMDVALEREEPSLDAAMRRIEQLKAACRAHAGLFTILWHNSRLVSRRDRRLYLHALDA